MLYHDLDAMARKHMPDLAPLIERAVVFHIDMIAHRSLAREWSKERRRRMDGFQLPYPITVIEDQASCVLLADPVPGQRGLTRLRLYIECVKDDLANNAEAFSDPFDVKCEAMAIQAPAGAVAITYGTIEPMVVNASSFMVCGQLRSILHGTPESVLYRMDDPDLDDPVVKIMNQTATVNVMTGLEEIVHIEDLVEFNGWPRPHLDLLNHIYEIGSTGRIEVSDRCDR